MGSFEQDYYEWEGFWDPSFFASGENAARIDLTAQMVPPEASSLADIGSGTGEFARRLSALRPEMSICCVDRSLAALDRVTTEKIQGSIDELPFPSRSREVVSCLQVLEHIPNPIYEKALSELARVSSRYLLVSVPYREDLEQGHTTCPSCGSSFNSDLHLRTYDDTSFRSLFDSHGFTLVRSGHAGPRDEAIGLGTYERIRNTIRPRPKPFRAPVCPICGFVRPKASGQVGSPASGRSAWPSVKTWILHRIPRRRLHDYWIIGLFERRGG